MPREVSVTTASKAAAYLDEELKHCQTMSTSNDFLFLFLDRITWKVREISVEREVMLCALGNLAPMEFAAGEAVKGPVKTHIIGGTENGSSPALATLT